MNTVDQARIDAFRAKIEQRKACEKKAFHTSMQLIEEDKVNDDTLMNAAVFIDQERYRGVNEDRAMKEICGYPLCSNKLPKDIPKNQYHINVKLNKVIDTTERRFFCSIFCYKASKYFERQIPKSPVWAREQEINNSYKVELLTPETLNTVREDNSIIISQTNYSRSIPQISQRRDASSSSDDDDEEDEFERLQKARDDYYKSRMKFKPQSTLVEKKLEQISLPDFIRTENKTIDFVISCLYEWFSNRTRDFLKNDQTTTTAPSSIDPIKYQQLVNRLDLEDAMSSEGIRAEKKLPTIDELKKTTEQQQYELKVKEFYCGIDTPKKEEAMPSTVILPPVDAYSQHTIRLSIVNEKIMTCFKQIFVDGISLTTINDLRIAVSELLLTFNYTGENIALKPNEWTIMTLFLIHLLIIKLPILTTHLSKSKIIESLLQTLNLSSDMIMHIVKYFLDNPIENQTTNFDDID